MLTLANHLPLLPPVRHTPDALEPHQGLVVIGGGFDRHTNNIGRARVAVHANPGEGVSPSFAHEAA